MAMGSIQAVAVPFMMIRCRRDDGHPESDDNISGGMCCRAVMPKVCCIIHRYRGTGDDALVLDAREPKQSAFPQSYQEVSSPLEIAAEIGNYLT
jgi:hypothetical protein